jgi:hypothetical protein
MSISRRRNFKYFEDVWDIHTSMGRSVRIAIRENSSKKVVLLKLFRNDKCHKTVSLTVCEYRSIPFNEIINQDDTTWDISNGSRHIQITSAMNLDSVIKFFFYRFINDKWIRQETYEFTQEEIELLIKCKEDVMKSLENHPITIEPLVEIPETHHYSEIDNHYD